ncbi:MAG: endolytic transglycosylase MltG [Clostridia bacterium]|nr:endolytic transglycosylase MltG [Clostridia bacterium]
MAEERRKSQEGESRPHTERKSSKRRKRRRSLGMSGALLYVVFVIGVSTLLAAVGWVAANDVLALNKASHTAILTVTEDEKFGDVVDALKENGIIESKTFFHLYAAFSHADQKLAPGTYELSTDMDYRAIVTNMGARSSSRLTVAVTIPEGYTVQQIFELLESKSVSTVEKLEDMAKSHNYKFSFLQDIPLGDYRRLEGYLFPDTYEFYLGEDPKTVINKMLVNFDRRITDDLRTKATSVEGRTLHDILIVASLIEKETDGADQTKIASVIYNRLNHPDKGTNGFLQIDASIQYVLPQRKEKLAASDLEIDSPYNTYKYTGLPAGPIANPGMAAINAALNPADTSSYYYALGDDGVHHFFKTLKEQQNFTATQELYKNNG